MKKSQMLQLVEDFLPSPVTLEMFYSVTIWKDNQVNLQGQYSSGILKAFAGLIVFTTNNPNGYVEAKVTLTSDEGHNVELTITLT